MKRFVLSLMAVVIFASSLMCSPLLCLKAEAAMPAEKSMENMPCCPKKADADKSSVMFKNCVKVDMLAQAGSGHGLLKKDTLAKVFAPVWEQALTHNFILADHKSIRGPPPDWPAVSHTQPPIILATLRIRE